MNMWPNLSNASSESAADGPDSLTGLSGSSALSFAFHSMLHAFQAQSTQAQQLVALAQPELLASDPSLTSFAQALAELEQSLKESENILIQEEEALDQVKSQLIPELQSLNQELEQQHEQTIQTTTRLINEAAANADVQMDRPPLANKSMNTSNSNKSSDPPRSAKKKGSNKDKEVSITGSSSSSSGSHKKSHLPVDGIKMAYVTGEEFERIPKYMRGRLELAKLNGAIDAWTALLREKYTLLNTKGNLKQLTEAQMKRYQAFSDEETDETTSSYFLSTDDLRSSAELQSLGSTNLKAVLVGLRHVGRVRNSTGSGAPKYILC